MGVISAPSALTRADIPYSSAMPEKFQCPQCGAATKVTRTTPNQNSIERSRVCENKHQFVTTEGPPDKGIQVLRSSGKIEPFNRRFALERSIRVASANSLPDDSIARLADDVVRRLYPSSEGPISTERIGDETLQSLALRSPAAAIRYAATFLTERGRISTVSEFVKWLIDNVPAVERRAMEAKAEYDAVGPSRPQQVIKKSRESWNSAPPEDFSIQKLFWGLRVTTVGLTPESWQKRHGADSHEYFVGALTAWVLEQNHGQHMVTTGQLGAACLRVLRSECPLGYLRFTTVAKGYESIKDLLKEMYALMEQPSPSVGLESYTHPGMAIAAEVREIEATTSEVDLRNLQGIHA